MQMIKFNFHLKKFYSRIYKKSRRLFYYPIFSETKFILPNLVQYCLLKAKNFQLKMRFKMKILIHATISVSSTSLGSQLQMYVCMYVQASSLVRSKSHINKFLHMSLYKQQKSINLSPFHFHII